MVTPDQEIIDLYQNELTNAKDIHEKLAMKYSLTPEVNKKYTLKKIKEVLLNIDVN